MCNCYHQIAPWSMVFVHLLLSYDEHKSYHHYYPNQMIYAMHYLLLNVLPRLIFQSGQVLLLHTYQTRRRSKFYYGNGNFCSTWCQDQWLTKHIEQALDHFGRTTVAKHLTEKNAWVKDYDYDWQSRTESNWRFVNAITNEQRPLTKAQFNDTNYTLNINTGE